MAKGINSSKQNIQKYEAGIVPNIPYKKIIQIAEFFNVHPSYLMGWTDNRNGDSPTNKDDMVQIEITLKEEKLVHAYRQSPTLQPVIDKILDLDK